MEPERVLAEYGLEAAILRVQEAQIDVVRFTHLAPLAEALMWVYALHEWHRHQLGNSVFFAECGDQGPAVPAIVWARGKVQHHIADVTRILDGRIDWVPLDLMAAYRNSGSDRFNRDGMYRQHVAARPIAEPLLEAYQFFLTLPDNAS